MDRPPSAGFQLESNTIYCAEMDRSEIDLGVTIIIFLKPITSPTSGWAIKISSPCHLISPLRRTRRNSQSLA